jgi:hypothetical protein
LTLHLLGVLVHLPWEHRAMVRAKLTLVTWLGQFEQLCVTDLRCLRELVERMVELAFEVLGSGWNADGRPGVIALPSDATDAARPVTSRVAGRLGRSRMAVHSAWMTRLACLGCPCFGG